MSGVERSRLSTSDIPLLSVGALEAVPCPHRTECFRHSHRNASPVHQPSVASSGPLLSHPFKRQHTPCTKVRGQGESEDFWESCGELHPHCRLPAMLSVS